VRASADSDECGNGGSETIATNQIDAHDPSQGTDPDKEAPVMLDATLPVSSVDPLPATSASPVLVSWSGTDPDSGVGQYDVQVPITH
jgi:hypothetical protein